MTNCTFQIVSDCRNPFPRANDEFPWLERDQWPAKWITVAEEPTCSFASAFQLCFNCDRTETIRLMVTADQRYQLFLNGKRIGLGPERGVLRQWFYETYEITVEQGKHCLQALCWFIDENGNRPRAQVSARPGFLLATADDRFMGQISTGIAPWKGSVLDSVTFLDTKDQVGFQAGGGARVSVVGKSPQELVVESGIDWGEVKNLEPGNNAFLMNTSRNSRVLYPGTLPPMKLTDWSGARVAAVRNESTAGLAFNEMETNTEECLTWQQMLESKSVATVAAGQTRQVLIDLGDYVCGYYRLGVTGKSAGTITVGWAERLSISPDAMTAPNERNQVIDRYFVGTWDHFKPSGVTDTTYEPLWWQAGRWILLSITAGDHPVMIKRFDVQETGYPLDKSYRFNCNDLILNAVAPVAFRTLQACVHETYMDCPFWEQLQYIGDTRLQALITYVTSGDCRLPTKAIKTFRQSMIGASPFLSSSYPSWYVAAIAPFSLWWICMLHDHGLWRGNKPLIKEMLPVAWWIIDHFLMSRTDDGLIRSPQGWNYIDACFPGQETPGGNPGEISGPLNWQVILALIALAELSSWVDENELATRASRLVRQISESTVTAFWDEHHGCLADDLEHKHYSEHSQCMGLMSGVLSKQLQQDTAKALLHDPDLLRALPYFTHYLCDAFADIGEGHTLVARLHQWDDFLKAGLSTFPEHHIEGRSDCHAWNAHPLYHMLRSILGIRPMSFGFEQVLIKPCPGPLHNISGMIPHPNGMISVDLLFSEKRLSAKIDLPEETSGQLIWSGKSVELLPGIQSVMIAR